MARTTRRDFARLAAVAVPALAATSGLTQTKPAPAKDAPPKPSPLAAAMTAVVRAEYGASLDAAQMERVAADFEEAMPSLQRFRAFELKNSDEPDFTFNPVVKR